MHPDPPKHLRAPSGIDLGVKKVSDRLVAEADVD
jgi:hypothetical protein